MPLWCARSLVGLPLISEPILFQDRASHFIVAVFVPPASPEATAARICGLLSRIRPVWKQSHIGRWALLSFVALHRAPHVVEWASYLLTLWFAAHIPVIVLAKACSAGLRLYPTRALLCVLPSSRITPLRPWACVVALDLLHPSWRKHLHDRLPIIRSSSKRCSRLHSSQGLRRLSASIEWIQNDASRVAHAGIFLPGRSRLVGGPSASLLHQATTGISESIPSVHLEHFGAPCFDVHTSGTSLWLSPSRLGALWLASAVLLIIVTSSSFSYLHILIQFQFVSSFGAVALASLW